MSLDRRHVLLGSTGLVGSLAAPTLLRAQGASINLYSARHYFSTDEVLYAEFTRQTGIAINRVVWDGNTLIQRLRADGANSPADVLLTVDAVGLELSKQAGLLQKTSSQLLDTRVPGHLRDPDGFWYGFSMRGRVIMYDRTRIQPEQVATYEDLANPALRRQIMFAPRPTQIPGNHTPAYAVPSYSESLVGSVLAANGPERTLEWAREVVANLARRPRGGDRDQIYAIADGDGSIAIANTYDLGNIIRANNPRDAEVIDKIRVSFPNQNDRGAHVNICGGGVVATARNKENAVRFLEYLASGSAQRHFVEANDEYPVVAGIAPPASVASFGTFRADSLNAGVLARNNAETLRIMDRAGWS